MEIGFEEAPKYIDNDEVHCIPFWSWLTEDHPEGCKLHFHKHVEIIYVACGKLDITINNEKFTLGADKICVIFPYEPHKTSCSSDLCYYSGFRFDQSELTTTMQTSYDFKQIAKMFIDTSGKQRIFSNSEFSVSCRGLLEKPSDIMEKKSAGYTFAIRARVLLLFVEILKVWEKNERLQPENKPDNIVTAIQLAKNYIIHNCADVDKQDLAKKCNMSYSYFARVFKKYVGMGISEYINHAKIEEAQRLLLANNASVVSVAKKLNFSSASHFIRLFKEYKNMTPKEFKQMYSV